MNPRSSTLIVLALGWVSAWVASPIRGADWPQFRGPDGSGISSETGLLQAWPPSGPPALWSVGGLGQGYGSVAVQGDQLFVMGTRGDEEVLIGLSGRDGSGMRMAGLGRKLRNDRGDGPRTTPTIDDARVYALSGEGVLACFERDNGRRLWAVNVLERFDAENIAWGVSASPVVEGDLVVVVAGGRRASLAALNNLTGETVWTTRELSDRAGYAMPIIRSVGDWRVLMTFTHSAGVGVRLTDGRLLWRYTAPANDTANCATPVFADNRVFYTSAYGAGAGLLELDRRGDQVTTREVYFTRAMQNHHGGVVLVDGFIYGFSGGGPLACLDFATGERRWEARSVTKGSLIYADRRLYLVGENHEVALAEASPEGYVERGRFTIPDRGRPSWAHPALADGRLFIRDQDQLLCYDLRERPAGGEAN